jgi:hypothetical protein
VDIAVVVRMTVIGRDVGQGFEHSRESVALATLLTLNPLGAPIAHIALHVSAVTHSCNTDTFLPPHR